MAKIGKNFYEHRYVAEVAERLLGQKICTFNGKEYTDALIVETEAYCGRNDKACHAHEKRTPRTEVMYGAGGHAYVYLCYGIHHLFNIVTNEKDQADAVLIRAVEPISGIDIMCQRRGMDKPRPNLTSGPGKLTQALGISVQQNGIYLLGSRVWLEEMAPIHPSKIVVSQRIGVDYAKEDALKPWRFYIKDNPWISRK